MNPTDLPPEAVPTMSRGDLMSGLFANLVLQQTNMALMFLGKVPHPESGQTTRDLEAATMLIDQLEMLAVKTKGNLSKQEENLLKQSLTSLRLSFVEAVENETQGRAATLHPDTSAATPAPSQPGPHFEPITSPSAAEEESRKKFTKRY